MKLKCPTCQKPVEWNEQFPSRPFCSERCKLIDLGEWASEERRIAGDPQLVEIGEDDGEPPIH